MPPAPFALLADDLVMLPTPWSADVEAYRTLFRKLHADAEFCHVAFGEAFEPQTWSDEEVRAGVMQRDITKRWGVRGMGDFALGLLPEPQHGSEKLSQKIPGKSLTRGTETVKIIEGDAFRQLALQFDKFQWVGYTCVRDATTAGGDLAELYLKEGGKGLPPWQEMIEIRYGMDPGFRGRGIATRAAIIVMDWAVAERGAKRFIAETEKHNPKSQRLLEKLGFERVDTDWFSAEPGELLEWQKVAVDLPADRLA